MTSRPPFPSPNIASDFCFTRSLATPSASALCCIARAIPFVPECVKTKSTKALGIYRRSVTKRNEFLEGDPSKSKLCSVCSIRRDGKEVALTIGFGRSWPAHCRPFLVPQTRNRRQLRVCLTLLCENDSVYTPVPIASKVARDIQFATSIATSPSFESETRSNHFKHICNTSVVS